MLSSQANKRLCDDIQSEDTFNSPEVRLFEHCYLVFLIKPFRNLMRMVQGFHYNSLNAIVITNGVFLLNNSREIDNYAQFLLFIPDRLSHSSVLTRSKLQIDIQQTLVIWDGSGKGYKKRRKIIILIENISVVWRRKNNVHSNCKKRIHRYVERGKKLQDKLIYMDSACLLHFVSSKRVEMVNSNTSKGCCRIAEISRKWKCWGIGKCKNQLPFVAYTYTHTETQTHIKARQTLKSFPLICALTLKYICWFFFPFSRTMYTLPLVGKSICIPTAAAAAIWC